MNIHEYQAKTVLSGYGAPIAKGVAVFSVKEAEDAARELGGPVWVVKSQIHAGGRGKGRFVEDAAGEAGGVRLARSVGEVVANAEQMLGNTLVTHQTGPAGRPVNRLYVEEGSAIARELYLSCLVDRATGRVAFIASQEGGMNIEEVAAETPAAGHVATVAESRNAASVRRLDDAFRYDFKVWTPAELLDACREAGFASPEFWRHTYDPSKGAAGVFLGATEPRSVDGLESWTAYVVARA